MFNRNKYIRDYNAGFSDGGDTNPVMKTGERKGEALEAYETGFEDAEADMAEYWDTQTA